MPRMTCGRVRADATPMSRREELNRGTSFPSRAAQKTVGEVPALTLLRVPPATGEVEPIGSRSVPAYAVWVNSILPSGSMYSTSARPAVTVGRCAEPGG